MARTPRHFDGTAKTGKNLSDLLRDAMREISAPEGQEAEAIFRYWPELIGGAMAPFTQPVSLVNGVLIVKVKSATLYSLLCQHEQPRLLKKLQEKFSVRSLVFRVG